VKINQKHRRETLLIASWLSVAVMLSTAASLHSDDRPRDTSASATEEAQRLNRNKESVQPNNPRETIGLVGPSAEEIHEFLYPAIQHDKAVTRPTA
jgi:hypothetical protein